MQKIVIITGLTASGKSKLGVQLAKEFNGEVISADSVQIYKRLNIGSAKDPIEDNYTINYKGVKIRNETDYDLTDEDLNYENLKKITNMLFSH